MARPADHLTDRPVDLVGDGLSEDEIAARVEDWLDELREGPGLLLPVAAADELSMARREGDV